MSTPNPSTSDDGTPPPPQEGVRSPRRGADKGPRPSLQGLASLERLRDHIDRAARELQRLRNENRDLADRLREIESRPAVDVQGTYLSFDEDPEAIRRKISGFIASIDRYLEQQRPSE